MGKPDLFEIKLNDSGPLLSGSPLKGHVLIRLKKELDIARVMIYLFGGGQLEFQDSGPNSRPGMASRAVYEDHETYLRLSQVMYSKSQNRRLNRNELYQMDFEFHLPTDTPSSFMTVVFYKLTAFLDCASKSHETTVPIVVINDLDLNRYSGQLRLLEPVDAWAPVRAKTDSGLVSARLTLHKRGFAIGETIEMQIEIYNNSKTKLENINACLVQRGTLKAYSSSGVQLRRVQRLLVRNLSLGRMRSAERLIIESAKIPVPWVVTSEIHKTCRLIEIEYFLQLTTSTQMLSGLTGASLSQLLCIGPEFKRVEAVSVLLEEEVAIGMRGLCLSTPESHAAAGEAAGAQASAPISSEGADLTMFTMVPSAPPSYDEAMTHEKVSDGMSSDSPTRDGP